MKNKKLFVIITSIVLLVIVAVLTLVNMFGKSAKKNSSCLGGGCAGCNGCGNLGSLNSAYYTAKEKQLLKTLDEKQKVFVNVLKDSYTEQEISNITMETKEAFIGLIPSIPYIGGDENELTGDIEQAAMVLAFYRVEKKYGKSADDVGKIVYSAIRDEMAKYPKWLMRWSGGKYFGKAYMKEVKADAAWSQKKEYPDGWVTEFVEGDGETFDYGVNHTECAIVKYFKLQNAEELTPYLCQLDFVYSEYLDEGLVRTSTLAQGAKYCDFRFKRVDNWKLDMLMLGVVCLIAISILSLITLLVRKIFLSRRKRTL